ncbi:MAG: hypothetical protein U0235_19760 [Polyangiaceae bacterium]
MTVDLLAAYGDTRIWAEDLGYEPGNASGKPRCSDGVDNDNDGLVDFPADPGCSAADDETENPGTFATGAGRPLFFAYPRVADVRGVNRRRRRAVPQRADPDRHRLRPRQQQVRAQRRRHAHRERRLLRDRHRRSAWLLQRVCVHVQPAGQALGL